MRILVVDDDRNILKEIENWGKEQGIEIVSAPSGVDAIRIMETDPNFDAAFVDLIMPGLHGLDTMYSLRKIKANLSVFLMANQREKKLAEKGIKFGAAGIIAKPIGFSYLSEAAAKIQSPPSHEELCDSEFKNNVIEILQMLIDTPASEEMLKIVAKKISDVFSLEDIKIWSLSRQTRTFQGVYPDELEELDLPTSGDYPNIAEGETIKNFLYNETDVSSKKLVVVKKRGKPVGFVLIEGDTELDENRGIFIGLIFGIVINWLWLEGSLVKSIDIQAKAEAEAEDLKNKLARAVALIEKMKERLKKTE